MPPPAPEATRGEDLDNYGKPVEPAASAAAAQKRGPWDLKQIALNVAKDCDGPALVRFVNTAPINLKTAEGKAARQACMNSATLLAVWASGGRTGDPIACAITKFHFKGRFSMEVSGVTRETCAAIHATNAPALVALGAKNPETGERNYVKILEGKVQPAMVVAAMREVLKGASFDRLSQDVQRFDKDLAAVEALQSQIAMKQGMMEQAARNPGKVAQLQAQIDALRKELAAAEAKLELAKTKFTDVG